MDISGIADKTATALGIPATPQEPASPPAAPAPPVAAAPAEPAAAAATVPPATPGTTAEKLTIDQIRAAVDRGDVKVEELSFVNPKLQSSFSKLKSAEKAVVTGIQKVLDDKGISLPDGKTVADIMNEPDGGKAFAELLNSALDKKLAPITQAMSAEELRTAISDKLVETVEKFPDIEPFLPLVGQAIKENPLLERAISDPEYIPLVLAGVARDFQWQEATKKVTALEAENTKLKEVLAAAQEAAVHGSATSKAANAPVPTSNVGAAENVRALAESLFDRAVAQAKGVVN